MRQRIHSSSMNVRKRQLKLKPKGTTLAAHTNTFLVAPLPACPPLSYSSYNLHHHLHRLKHRQPALFACLLPPLCVRPVRQQGTPPIGNVPLRRTVTQVAFISNKLPLLRTRAGSTYPINPPTNHPMMMMNNCMINCMMI